MLSTQLLLGQQNTQITMVVRLNSKQMFNYFACISDFDAVLYFFVDLNFIMVGNKRGRGRNVYSINPSWLMPFYLFVPEPIRVFKYHHSIFAGGKQSGSIGSIDIAKIPSCIHSNDPTIMSRVLA